MKLIDKYTNRITTSKFLDNLQNKKLLKKFANLPKFLWKKSFKILCFFHIVNTLVVRKGKVQSSVTSH
jgi:hypothetical protein